MAICSRLNTISICTGYDGIGLGIGLVESEYKNICYVEREAFAVANLVTKMQEGVLDEAPVWSDLKTFDGAAWRGQVDLVTAGIPCQPFSKCGTQQKTKDERWLWPALWRVVCQVQPRYLFLENIAEFMGGGLGSVISDLAEMGWSAEWGMFSAAEVGAPHQRRRFFLLAHPDQLYSVRRDSKNGNDRRQLKNKKKNRQATGTKLTRHSKHLADTASAGLQSSGQTKNRIKKELALPSRRSHICQDEKLAAADGRKLSKKKCQSFNACQSGVAVVNTIWPAGQGEYQHDWEEPRATKPRLGRAVNGLASRVDRLRLCGNGVIPLVAAKAWSILKRRLDEG